jgi:hypothetical protein
VGKTPLLLLDVAVRGILGDNKDFGVKGDPPRSIGVAE